MRQRFYLSVDSVNKSLECFDSFGTCNVTRCNDFLVYARKDTAVIVVLKDVTDLVVHKTEYKKLLVCSDDFLEIGIVEIGTCP